jgi:N6-adenosine-specific RNA methylase IME4
MDSTSILRTDRRRFPTLLLDPPWEEKGGGKIKRGADRHYKTLKLKAIFQEIWMSPIFRPTDNAHMYLWVTDNFLPQGIELARQLGFRYIHTISWIKLVNEAFEVIGEKQLEKLRGRALDDVIREMLKMGLGQYFRGSKELALFCVKGKGYDVCTEARDLNDVLIGPRGKHSAKPDCMYDLIEARSVGPYAEFFARGCCERENWTFLG